MADQISEHEIRVFEAARVSTGWKTAKELAASADVADRTSRMHCGKLAEVGVLEVAKVFGGYRYRCSLNPSGAAIEYLTLLESAKRVFNRRGGDASPLYRNGPLAASKTAPHL